MAKITEKNTKKEILEALQETEKELANLRTANMTTADVVKKEEIKVKEEQAADLIDMNILNDTITTQYKSLIDTIAMYKSKIEELHKIEVGLDTLESIVIVQHKKEEEYRIANEKALADFKLEYAEKKMAAEQEIADLKTTFAKTKATLQDEYNQLKKDLEKQRNREEEEYNYNLKRERAIENDKWIDEKTIREKELAVREAAIIERENRIAEMDAKIEELTANYNTLLEEQKVKLEKAFADGEAKAEKTCAIKINAIKKDADWEAELAKSKIEALNKALLAKEDEAKELRAKLDSAYTRIQEMAIEQSKSAAPRIIESNNK